MTQRITWKATPEWIAKNPKKSTQICRIGEDNDSAVFYETQEVEQAIAALQVDDAVTFTFRKEPRGKRTAMILTSITKVANQPAPAAPAATTAPTGQGKFAAKDPATQRSIERQVSAYVAGDIMQALQGQVTPDDVCAAFEKVFDVVYKKIVG